MKIFIDADGSPVVDITTMIYITITQPLSVSILVKIVQINSLLIMHKKMT